MLIFNFLLWIIILMLNISYEFHPILTFILGWVSFNLYRG